MARVSCNYCGGTGVMPINGPVIFCRTCNGTGFVDAPDPRPPRTTSSSRTASRSKTTSNSGSPSGCFKTVFWCVAGLFGIGVYMNIPDTDALKQLEGNWKCRGSNGNVFNLNIAGDVVQYQWVSPDGSRSDLNGTSLKLLTKFDPHRFSFKIKDAAGNTTGIWRLDGKTLTIQLPDKKDETYPPAFTSDKSKLWIFQKQ